VGEVDAEVVAEGVEGVAELGRLAVVVGGVGGVVGEAVGVGVDAAAAGAAAGVEVEGRCAVAAGAKGVEDGGRAGRRGRWSPRRWWTTWR
jgi:hypothetical protein